MPCDSRLKPRQTIQQRADEVRRVVARLAEALTSGRVKVVVGPQGAVAFEGWDAASRDGVTDACAVRRILATGNVMARLAIEKAEILAGRKIDKQAIAAGWHSHDGGRSWHHGH